MYTLTHTYIALVGQRFTEYSNSAVQRDSCQQIIVVLLLQNMAPNRDQHHKKHYHHYLLYKQKVGHCNGLCQQNQKQYEFSGSPSYMEK